MHRLKIGIPINDTHNPLSGGSYTYITQFLEAIDRYDFDKNVEIVFLNFEKKLIQTRKPLITFHPFRPFTLSDLIRKFFIITLIKIPLSFIKKISKRLNLNHENIRNIRIKSFLNKHKIDLLFYIFPSGNLYNFPFITTHWDIGHKSTYMFPEFTDDFEVREAYYKKVLPKALFILTETQTGKEELINYTNLNRERISVMPIFPGNVIYENINSNDQQKILEKFRLEKLNFLLYPAQFWPHKNHTLLIDAFKKILNKYPNLKLIFTGSDKGNLKYIQNYITDRNLEKNIIILGFVSNSELYSLYKNSIALVMPTFLGPSNMPPLEAAYLNCPVILSNLEGHYELLGDFGYYFDPTDVNALYNHIYGILSGEAQKKTFKPNQFNIDNTLNSLENTFLKALTIRKNWG